MKPNIVNYHKVASQLHSLHQIAHDNLWVTRYDKDLDEFYLTPEEIDKSFSLHEIGKEFLVYLDKDSNIGGVFMEYFKDNLTSHDEKFKPFKKMVLGKEKFGKTDKNLLITTLEAALYEAVVPKLS